MIRVPHKYENSLKGFNFIDLFAGLGGFRLALQSFGAKCIYSDEWDKNVAKIYKENFHNMPHGDITKIPVKGIPNHDILCAGFPCQAFSISGKELGFQDTRGTLFFNIAKIVKVKHPKIVFMENVRNLVHHDHGKTFKVIRNTMIELGYTFNYKVINASHYGIPQNRERVYMVCFRKNLQINNFHFPLPLKSHPHVKDILINERYVPKNCYKQRSDINIYKEDNTYGNRPIRVGTVGKGGQGNRIYSIKGTGITLSAYGGGLFSKTGGYLVNGKTRKLAPRECARMMGFPDDYIISKNNNSAYKQFGNSVVVNVLQYICEQIVNSIYGYKNVDYLHTKSPSKQLSLF